MTSEEFTEWSVMFSAEELHPSAERMRHAQLVAALHNGPVPRVDKRRWKANDFLSNPWETPAPAAKRRLTASQIATQVASINATRHRRGQ